MLEELTVLVHQIYPIPWCLYVAHETATCCNPPTHDFTGDKKKLSRSLTDQYVRMLCLQKYVKKQFFCRHIILTEVMFETQLSNNWGI